MGFIWKNGGGLKRSREGGWLANRELEPAGISPLVNKFDYDRKIRLKIWRRFGSQPVDFQRPRLGIGRYEDLLVDTGPLTSVCG